MLYLIGLGLDKDDMTLKAVNAIKNCKRVFMETYTSDLIYSFKDIEKVLSYNHKNQKVFGNQKTKGFLVETRGQLKKIEVVDRKFVEEENMLFEEAKRHNVALLIPGDPLSATTHSELLSRAEKFNVRVKVIHAPSILTSIGITGLQLYKFGKTASIPKWQKSFEPDSFYSIIQDNRRINAHTLLLIDIGLKVKDALMQLQKVIEKREIDNLSYKETRRSQLEKEKIIVCSNLGTDRAEIKQGTIQELMKKDFKLPACIIIPAPLHFFEEQMLKKHAKKK